MSKRISDVLAVLEVAQREWRSPRHPLSVSLLRQAAISEIAGLRGVAPQTIQDACVRRMGLGRVADFDELLLSLLHGEAQPLRDLLCRRSLHTTDLKRIEELLRRPGRQPRDAH